MKNVFKTLFLILPIEVHDRGYFEASLCFGLKHKVIERDLPMDSLPCDKALDL